MRSALAAGALCLFLAGFGGGLDAADGESREVRGSGEFREVSEIAAAFAAAGASGTFVMADPKSGDLVGHDAVRAERRFVPASTFKVANTLIGLDCGAVADVDEVLPYGGGKHAIAAWERDMSLREAIPMSNVPVYQELARRIGLERMEAGVRKLGYGNERVGAVVDRFWLDGPLAISAVEQVDFLGRLAGGDLPVSAEALAGVVEISELERTDAFALHGKTGWAPTAQPGIGWFVGWVERDGVNYPFALNMDVPGQETLPTRVALARKCLSILGVLPP